MSSMEKLRQEIASSPGTVRLTILGKELLIKEVARSGKSGRIYLPLGWVGKTVKIVRIN